MKNDKLPGFQPIRNPGLARSRFRNCIIRNVKKNFLDLFPCVAQYNVKMRCWEFYTMFMVKMTLNTLTTKQVWIKSYNLLVSSQCYYAILYNTIFYLKNSSQRRIRTFSFYRIKIKYRRYDDLNYIEIIDLELFCIKYYYGVIRKYNMFKNGWLFPLSFRLTRWVLFNHRQSI